MTTGSAKAVGARGDLPQLPFLDFLSEGRPARSAMRLDDLIARVGAWLAAARRRRLMRQTVIR
jgi:hypothetical protein